MKPAHHFFVLAAMALGAACAGEAVPLRPATEGAGNVQALIGDAGCETDAQCETIGVGAKACGGPSSYLAWSRLHTDPAALQAAAQQEEAVQRKAMQARGEMSTCSMVPDPGAWCDRTQARANAPAGVCRLRSPGRDGSPAIR